MRLSKILKEIEQKKAVSAWSKGVKTYAIELVSGLLEDDKDYDFYGSPADSKRLLNGAYNWNEYSWNGCTLIYNEDIAERLCTPTELKLTKNGKRNPNNNEQWLDCQERALIQAERMIKSVYKSCR